MKRVNCNLDKLKDERLRSQLKIQNIDPKRAIFLEDYWGKVWTVILDLKEKLPWGVFLPSKFFKYQ